MDTASVIFYLYFSSEGDDDRVVTAVSKLASLASNSNGAGSASNSYGAGSASNYNRASTASNSYGAGSATKSDSDGIGLGAALGITGKLCTYVTYIIAVKYVVSTRWHLKKLN